MKAVVFFAGLLLCAPVSFAQNIPTANVDTDEYELEVGAMPYEETEELNEQMELQRNGAEDVIGGIIGSIFRPGRGGGGGRGDDGWGGGGGGGGGYRDVVCYARDRRGNTYRAAGPNPRRVQQRAMDKCQRNARFCRPLGCQAL